MAAGRREDGEKADTLTSPRGLPGKRRRAWLGRTGHPPLLTAPSGGRGASTVWGRCGWRGAGVAGRSGRTETMQMEKKTSRLGQIFQGSCQWDWGILRLRGQSNTQSTGSSCGVAGWEAGEATDPTAEISHLVKNCQQYWNKVISARHPELPCSKFSSPLRLFWLTLKINFGKDLSNL